MSVRSDTGANDALSDLVEQWLAGNAVEQTVAEPLLDRLRSGEPTILPRLSGGALVLYGVAHSAAGSRGLAAELTAAIGPSWSDFAGHASELDYGDAFERTLAAWQHADSGGPVLRARVRPDADTAEVWAALARLLAAWQRRPPQDRSASESTARLLADLELALQTGAIDQARLRLETLRAGGTYGRENLLFLEVQLLGAASRFEELLHHPRLDELLNRPRPARVSDTLFQAIHALHLAAHAAARDLVGARQAFAERVRPRFDRLLRSRGPLESFAAIESLLLAAASDGRPPEERKALAEAAATTDAQEREWLALLAESKPAGTAAVADAPSAPQPARAPDDRVAEAQELLVDNRFDDVLELLRTTPPTLATVQLLVQAAEELDTLGAAAVLRGAFEALSDADQAAFRRSRFWATALDRLLAVAGETSAIASWPGLLAGLAAGTAVRVEEIASRGALEWDPAWPASAAEGQELAELLLAVPDQHRDALYLTIPHLLSFMDRRPRVPAVQSPVDHAILELLTYGDFGGRIVQEALLAVLDRILDVGVEASRYIAVIDDIEDVWEAIRSRRTLDWFLDVLGVFAQHPCPDDGARRRLFQRAVAEALGQRELDEVTRDALIEIAQDIQALALIEPLQDRAPVELTTTPDAAPPPAPAVIGIYSLSESEARRAGAILQRMFPTSRVEFNHEYDSSPMLEAFAARADVLAMVVARAKHAATIALRRACPPTRMAEVYGRGSTAIVRAVVEHLASAPAVVS